MTVRPAATRIVVYTDGACSGNPGPGGWAWAVAGGSFASGAVPHTTNQRMEITAALEAIRALPGPLEVVSDSTYVVNCFKQRWHDGWRANGWRNSQKKPVANRDLWEPFIELALERGGVPAVGADGEVVPASGLDPVAGPAVRRGQPSPEVQVGGVRGHEAAEPLDGPMGGAAGEVGRHPVEHLRLAHAPHYADRGIVRSITVSLRLRHENGFPTSVAPPRGIPGAAGIC